MKSLSHGIDQHPTPCRGKNQKTKKGRWSVRNKKTEPKEEYKRRPSWI
jgi:hypothetical protein